jgi:exodeoxyribonuclease VII large subunit
MLDSAGMSEEKPPTLASLRARRSLGRTGKTVDTAPQLGLIFSTPAAPPTAVVKARPASKIAIAPPVTALPLERRIWSVRDLVNDVRRQVEAGYSDIWVEGEISNCRIAPSGHIYFTLKDGEAQLPIILFRRQAILLRFRPTDGLAVLVRGKISVYETRGQLQLIAETMEPRGAGALQLAFEQLKARLLAEGLFDAAGKRPLPTFPHCIGIVTSPTGAVVQDIVNITRRRHARLNLLIYPATMQGPNCPSSVAAGIRWFNANPGKVDLIILARGGGSIEDLAGFNNEALARIIAASALPIVSAIGHETDFTIADFVADLRAPTPSAAAEIVTAAQHRIEERVAALDARVHRAIRFRLLQAQQRLSRLSAESVLMRIRDGIGRREQHLDRLGRRLEVAMVRRLRSQALQLEGLSARLARQHFALRLADSRHRLQSADQRLRQFAERGFGSERNRLARASGRLEALSPLAVLQRGYALAYSSSGKLLRSADEVSAGDDIRVRLGVGSVAATVRDVSVDSSK